MNFEKISKSLLVLILVLSTGACSHFSDRAKDKEKAKIYLQLGADQFAQREFNKALESTLEALKYDPESAAAFNHLGIIYMETKRFPKAEESLKKALELQNEYPEAQNNLGVLYNRMEKFTESIKFFEKALASDKYLTPENALS